MRQRYQNRSHTPLKSIAAAIKTRGYLCAKHKETRGFYVRSSQPSNDLLRLAEYCPDGRNCRDQPDQDEGRPDRLPLLCTKPIRNKQAIMARVEIMNASSDRLSFSLHNSTNR
jgi:hypothetical protein